MVIVHLCLSARGDQTAHNVANCGSTAIEFFGEAVDIEFFHPFTFGDFDCKVGRVFGQEDEAHEVHVREQLGNSRAVVQRPIRERA